MENKITYRKLSEIKELAGNPRTISRSQFEKLKQSVKDNPDYFEARPIILSDRTGELVILAGNQRYRAAKALGLAEVPTIVLEGLTEEREREIIIRDNVENGDWDFDILANEWDIGALQEWGIENFQSFAADIKENTSNEHEMARSIIVVDGIDEIKLTISEVVMNKLLKDMLSYREEHNSYDGFWDWRLEK